MEFYSIPLMSLSFGQKIQNLTKKASFYTVIALKGYLNDFDVKAETIKNSKKGVFFSVFAEDEQDVIFDNRSFVCMLEDVFCSFFHLKKIFAFV